MKKLFLIVPLLVILVGTACDGAKEPAEPTPVPAIEEAQPAEVLYTLKVDAYPEEWGLVYPSEKQVPANSSVEVQAIPAPGYEFEGWSGADSSTFPNLTLTMDGD
ncbi:MAG: hypothetical protein WBB69_08425 [Anaerolineales bacterium]